MEKVSEYGYLTMREVQLIYTNKTWSYDVMKTLRGRGWISDFDTAMSPKTGHYLTPDGYRILTKQGRLKTSFRFKVERYSPFIFRHRMACARVGLALEKHPLVLEFLPESLLWKRRKNETDKLCDAEFLYGVPGREETERVGLEVELTLKNKDRLAESFDQLGRRGLDQVWWICGDETILNALRHQIIERPLRFDQRHLFCLLDEFLAVKEHRACLIDAGGQEFTIDPAAPTLGPRRPEPPAAPAIAPPQQPATGAPRHHESAVKKTLKIEPQAEPAPLQACREPGWIRHLSSETWRWFRHDFLGDFAPREHSYDSREREQISRRKVKLFLMGGVLACFGLAGTESVSRFRRLTVHIRDWPARLSAGASASTPKWRSLRPDAVFWKLGDMHFSVGSFEAKGEQYRIRLNLERLSENMGGCVLDHVAMNDSKGRRLARWKFSNVGIFGRESWNSEPLSFRAPMSMRRFIVTVEFIPKAFECGRWDVPVSFE